MHKLRIALTKPYKCLFKPEHGAKDEALKSNFDGSVGKTHLSFDHNLLQ